jgi:hypothetical protein
MYFRALLALIVALCLAGGAHAQNSTAQQVVTGYLSTVGCPSVALTPCFVQYGSGGGSGGSVTQGTVPWVISKAPGTPTVSASGSVTSLVLDASPTTATGGVQYFHAENTTATGGYCILYNGTTAPGTGALTAANVLAFQLLPASGYCDWTATNAPIAASAGAVVLISSAATPFTYTTGVITASVYGLAQ